jgi:nicotinamide-nucleotide amidase
MSTQAIVAQLDYVQIDDSLVALAVEALARAKRCHKKLVTAESCTGGLVATVLSEAPGAAEYFTGAFVTYTMDQKCAALGLDRLFLAKHGAVSEAVARAMAEAALRCCNADVSASVTGVAGPDPDENGNPVGLVYVARATTADNTALLRRNFGDIGRHRIRYAAAAMALQLLTEF